MRLPYTLNMISKSEYPRIIAVWEASVRATHHFLKEEDIQYFKPLILTHYLDLVELRGIRNDAGAIIGFTGTADCQLEMLFVHPEEIGKGIGKALLLYAIEQMKITSVDVNEQNELATSFYLHHGFEIIGRSDFDNTGKPYPILHMKLNNSPIL